ncbi:MAG: hypothetical protein ACOC6C_02880 [Verrucomicrobiota bacterium]
MTFGDILLVVLAIGGRIAIVGIFIFFIVRRILRARQDKRDLHKRVQDAIKKIIADGKIEGPKGKYKPKRWARKWIDYSNSLPAPRQHYEMHGREMPTLGRDE